MNAIVVAHPITMDDYWMGRREIYVDNLTPEIEANAVRTVGLANQLLQRAADAGIYPSTSGTGFGVTDSGWRPPAINSTTPRAAKNSKHMLGLAVDVSDDDGDLDEWLMTDEGQRALEEIGLWLEHPASTKGWCHLQSVAPGSGRRVFYP